MTCLEQLKTGSSSRNFLKDFLSRVVCHALLRQLEGLNTGWCLSLITFLKKKGDTLLRRVKRKMKRTICQRKNCECWDAKMWRGWAHEKNQDVRMHERKVVVTEKGQVSPNTYGWQAKTAQCPQDSEQTTTSYANIKLVICWRWWSVYISKKWV